MKYRRREFLKNGTLFIGAMGISTSGSISHTIQAPPDPDPEFLDEELYLWPDESENNGKNPNYRPKMKIYYPTLRRKDEDSKYAAILVCPGGGYYVQAPHEGQPFA